MTLAATPTTTSSLTRTETIRPVWTEADKNLWVADAGGAFGGSVDLDRGGYVARDPFGRERGVFRSLAQAQSVLEAFLAHPAMSRYFGGSHTSAR
jgi:hypothetical protein